MNKAKIGGILEIVSGAIGLIYSVAWLIVASLRDYFSNEALGLPPILHTAVIVIIGFYLVFSVFALVGGILALRKQRWGLALTGAIFSVMIMFYCGVPALIFIAQARPEFKANTNAV